MKYEFSSILACFDSNLWSYHVIVPDEIYKVLTKEGNKRVVCIINETHKTHAALLHYDFGYFILINNEIRKKFNLSLGSRLSLTLESDNSEYGMPMPEEFSAVLDQDELGNKYFHALTPGKQRSLLYLVGKIKSTQIKINKSLAIMHHLCVTKGNLDYKLLNEHFKEFNHLK